MSLELTVRGKTYKVEVDSKGTFATHLDEEDGKRSIQADTLKGLEQKLTVATRVRTAKVAIKLKRLGHKPASGGYGRYSYGVRDESRPWEVIEVTVRGINEHTGHPMVTWPNGAKGDDEEVGRYSSRRHIYFPTTMSDEEILKRRRLIEETKQWFEKNAVDVVDLARKAVAEALGESQ